VQPPEIFQRMNHCQIQVKIIFEGGGRNTEIIIFNFYKMFQRVFDQFFNRAGQKIRTGYVSDSKGTRFEKQIWYQGTSHCVKLDMAVCQAGLRRRRKKKIRRSLFGVLHMKYEVLRHKTQSAKFRKGIR